MRAAFTLLCWFFVMSGFTQSDKQLLSEPSLNLGYKLSSEYKLNVGLSSRQLFREKEGFDGNVSGYEYLHSDVSADLSRDVGLNNKIQVGYLLRQTEDGRIHRLRQRFTIVRNHNALRLSHRFGTEQTFSFNEDTEYRARYRIAPEIALAGLVVDPEEFYLKATNEFVVARQGNDSDIEIRVSPNVGYLFTSGLKLESGVTYRFDEFLDTNGRHRLFFGLSGYYNF